MTDEEFFVSEAVGMARGMSYCDGLRFLSGMVLTCGDVDEIQPVREALMLIKQGDAQLELIFKPGLRAGASSGSCAQQPRVASPDAGELGAPETGAVTDDVTKPRRGAHTENTHAFSEEGGAE